MIGQEDDDEFHKWRLLEKKATKFTFIHAPANETRRSQRTRTRYIV